MKRLMHCIGACVIALVGTTLLAEAEDLSTLLPSLKAGGYVIVIRHGATNADEKDVYPLNYDDITKQRQLSPQGKEVARQTGTALKTLGIPIGKVYASHLNRALETGRLIASKEPVPNDDLNDSSMGSASAMAGSSASANERYGAALRQLVATRPDAGTNTLIVTHKTNIQDAFGQKWSDIKEGESLLFKPDGSANLVPVARVEAVDWTKPAQVR